MRLRESYELCGPANMGDADLLALILGTGTQGSSAVEVAQQALTQLGGLTGVRRAEVQQLASIRGVGRARAIRIHAALQLGRRALATPPEQPVVRCADDAHRLLAPAMADLQDEELHALFLDRRRRCVARRALTRGCHAYTIVDPRQVFRVALQLGASAVLLAHNHPSGDPTPSPQDLEVTDRVVRAGRLLGLPLLDHLVIARQRYVSLAERGHVPVPTAFGTPWTD